MSALSLARIAFAIAGVFSLLLQPCIVCSAHDSNSVYSPHIIDRLTAQVKRPGLRSVFRCETRMNRNSFTYPSHTFSKITGYMHEQYRRVLYSATIVTYRGGEGKPSCTHHTSIWWTLVWCLVRCRFACTELYRGQALVCRCWSLLMMHWS